MKTLFQDLRYGVRLLTKHPGFTAVAVITIALGIGANAAIFSVVDAALLRPLPYQEPNRLVMLEANFLRLGMERIGASPPEFIDYRNQCKSCSNIAAFSNSNVNLTGVDHPDRVSAALVSASLFPMLGQAPMIGRTFNSEEELLGHNTSVILSYALWQSHYGADQSVVGKSLSLGGSSYTIVGVMPPSFEFPHPSFPFAPRADLWLPLAFTADQLQERSAYNLRVLARLKPDVSLEQARQEMAAIASRMELDNPRSYRGPGGEDGGWRIAVVPLQEAVAGSIRSPLLLMLGAVGFVLLIACANVANMLLSRAVARKTEMAVRMALGASRLRLILQLLTETLPLAFVGGALGLFLASIVNELLLWLNPVTIPRVQEVGLDLRVLAFTFGISLLTGLVFGLMPALHGSAYDLNGTLKDGTRGAAGNRSGARIRDLLVVGEVALALLLLIGGGLLIKSFRRVLAVDPGFSTQNLMTMEMTLPQSKYQEAREQSAFFRQLLVRVQSLPGVQSSAAISLLPLSGRRFDGPMSIEGRPLDMSAGIPVANYRVISSNYFQTMGIPLLQGRVLDEHDVPNGENVVVVNQALRRAFFPHEDPIGKRIKLGAPNAPSPWLTIVGVVAGVREGGLDADIQPEMYVSYQQRPTSSMALVIRTPMKPGGILPAVRGEVLAIDREQPIYNVRTIDQLLGEAVSNRRFNAFVMVIFGGVAMVLAGCGLYGVMSYSVAERTREIGVRMALGAKRGAILRLVIRQGMTMTMVGLAIGLTASFLLTRLMSKLLFGVTATDPATFIGNSLVLAFVALLACYIPARRATKVDPLVALRYE